MANTPFLDLVKPAGTDRALVSVINSNSDKIDTGVSTLSEQIGNLNKNLLEAGTSIPSGSNINSYTTVGKYYCPSGSVAGTLTNPPWNNVGFTLQVVVFGADWIHQIANTAGLLYQKERLFNASSQTWTDWQQLVMKSDSTYGYWTLVGSTAKTFNLSKNARLLLTTEDSTPNRCGMLFVYTTSDGTTHTYNILNPSGITIDESVKQQITLTSPGSTRIKFENLEGTPITNVVTEQT